MLLVFPFLSFPLSLSSLSLGLSLVSLCFCCRCCGGLSCCRCGCGCLFCIRGWICCRVGCCIFFRCVWVCCCCCVVISILLDGPWFLRGRDCCCGDALFFGSLCLFGCPWAILVGRGRVCSVGCGGDGYSVCRPCVPLSSPSVVCICEYLVPWGR